MPAGKGQALHFWVLRFKTEPKNSIDQYQNHKANLVYVNGNAGVVLHPPVP
jgi:hypothetical protein